MAGNPYVEARREWDERYADLVLGKRNWQIASGGLLALSLILASGVVWLTTRSRFIPYVVEVDKLGYALTVPQPLTPSAVPDVTARMERATKSRILSATRVRSPAIPRSSTRRSTRCSRTRATRRTDSSTPITTPTASRITRSRSPRSKPSRSRSIRSSSYRHRATRCAGPKCKAI